jgi:hypothetical protein
MYSDEDLFLHEAIPRTSFFKFPYNRRMLHYQILENTTGLVAYGEAGRTILAWVGN